MPVNDDLTYDPPNEGTRLVLVPTELAIAINLKLDEEIAKQPEAAKDREYLYNALLSYYNEYGTMPSFTLQKEKE